MCTRTDIRYGGKSDCQGFACTNEMLTNREIMISTSHQIRPSHMVVSETFVYRTYPYACEMRSFFLLMLPNQDSTWWYRHLQDTMGHLLPMRHSSCVGSAEAESRG